MFVCCLTGNALVPTESGTANRSYYLELSIKSLDTSQHTYLHVSEGLVNPTDEGAAGNGLLVERDRHSVRLPGHWHERDVIQPTRHRYDLEKMLRDI